MGTSAWTPVDESASAWTPVAESKPAPKEETGVLASLKRTGSGLLHLPGAVIDAFTKPPQNDDEKAIIGNTPGTRFEGDAKISLALKRLISDPMKAERDKAAQAREQEISAGVPQMGDPGNTGHPLLDNTLGRVIDFGDKPTNPQAQQVPKHVANMHDIAGMVPVLGPMAADISQRYMSGDKSGAITDVLTNAALPKAAEGTAKGLSSLVRGAAPAVAERMYQSALKPSTTASPAENLAAVRTGLNAAIPISEQGAQKLGGLIQDLNDKIKAEIASNPNAPINKFQVASRLNKPAADFAKQAAPTADLNTIADVGNDFLKSHPGNITAQDAQAIKQGTYKQIGDRAYGEASTARVEAEKSLARGLKEELEQHFPEIKGLNAQESKFFDLQGSLERAVNRAANRQTIPARLGGPLAGTIAGAAGTAAMGSKAGAGLGLAVGVMKTVLDDPMLQSKLAIALNKAGRGSISPAIANVRVQQFVNSLAQSVNGAQANQQ